ncbi:hypothetical protein CARUB_v10027535mg [Capsella rubella]|uniref:DUF3741 domain-containing protein n=1 Tax=Capsella rubella TaxID=81985 RepID=R0GCG3_9BRAS|nr:uncharacterized protein LOC17876621 [Capsella rubella]XP_023636532.1 uncharacterized protein LOC17876621 [Capsella rubella]EOA14354.1 hypothetical protein CARUB_v10027535mg [Capsella rubella]
MKVKSSSSSPSLPLGSKTHSFGCISLILDRFLCSGSSSTCPYGRITEPCFESRDFVSEPLRVRGDEPGAVARLMGLDSIPVTDRARVVSRSRSVNSAGYMKRDDDTVQGKHRRVKSTLDSYQFPEYVELEDDKFFILSFEKDKTEKKGFGELKQPEERKCKKRRETRENQTHIEGKENNINAMNVSPGRHRFEIGELNQPRKEKRKNRRKRRAIELRQNIETVNCIKSNDCWSRGGDSVSCDVRSTKEEEDCRSCNDSSPVSVLDYDWLAGVRVTPSSEKTSRRQLCSELESSKHNETIQEDYMTLTSRSRESKVRGHSYQEMWLMICKLTVSDLDHSNWGYGKASNFEVLEGIISEDILDQLLVEIITTLSLTSQV